MWNNPRALEVAARAALAIALLLMAVVAQRALLRSPWPAVRTVSVGGALLHTGRAEIERAVSARLTAGLLGVDLDAIRAELQRLPWVRRADLRRVWPDRIEVELVEHEALARWGAPGSAELVNTHGERFSAPSDDDLPVLAGPPGSEALLAQRYRIFSAQLAALDLSLHGVTLSARHAWLLGTRGGLQLALGREVAGDPVEERLARFVRAYRNARGGLERRYVYVDLRYPNGFALRPGAREREAGPAQLVKG